MLSEEHKQRYNYPRCASSRPAGRISNGPGSAIYKVSIATQTMNMAQDLEDPRANSGGTILEAVTKDQLNTGLTGQIRYRVAENNCMPTCSGSNAPSCT
jgi:hypothetical protein